MGGRTPQDGHQGLRRDRATERSFRHPLDYGGEIPAIFQRADLVVLPYREIDQSGVAFTALAFGRPLLLSDAGGSQTSLELGAARIVPAGDAVALGMALREILDDEATREEMGAVTRTAATVHFRGNGSRRRPRPCIARSAPIAPAEPPSKRGLSHAVRSLPLATLIMSRIESSSIERPSEPARTSRSLRLR